MRRMIFLGCIIIFLAPMGWAQEKCEAPVWNIGDKWSFTGNVTMMIVNADESNYMVKFITSTGESIYIYEKTSLNRIYSMEGERRIKYKGGGKRLLNFPLDTGKSWKDNFMSKPIGASPAAPEWQYFETRTVLGWEDIVIQAEKFKALKLEYKQERVTERPGLPNKEGKAWYWYSPDVKYLVKYQYEKSRYWGGSSDWELTSFELKK